MRMMITGSNLRIVRVSDKTDGKSAAEWLSAKACRQPRTANGRWTSAASGGRRRKDGEKRGSKPFQRFFVLARPL